jgi:hypothetical protein
MRRHLSSYISSTPSNNCYAPNLPPTPPTHTPHAVTAASSPPPAPPHSSGTCSRRRSSGARRPPTLNHFTHTRHTSRPPSPSTVQTILNSDPRCAVQELSGYCVGVRRAHVATGVALHVFRAISSRAYSRPRHPLTRAISPAFSFVSPCSLITTSWLRLGFPSPTPPQHVLPLTVFPFQRGAASQTHPSPLLAQVVADLQVC